MPKKQTIKKTALIPTALISGGAGFIGSHLAEALLSNKARVIVLDNFSTGKQIHVKHLLNNPNFALYDVDINQGLPQEIESVDYIFHFAGLEEYLYSKDLINLESLLTNSLGTKLLLDLARNSDAKFLLASTVDVYEGRMSQLDLTTYFGSSNVEENKFSLTEAKRFGEAVVWEYYKKYDVNARIVRLPEVYGPRMNLEATGCLGSYLRSLIEKRDITVAGDGTDKEFYLYISDAISGIIKSFFNDNTKGNIYSLVTDPAVSQLEVAYMVKGLADGEVNIEFESKNNSLVPRSRFPDTFNLKDLDWEQRVPLKDGVVNTLTWFGYTVNTNSFKPAKLIQQKVAGDPIWTGGSERIFGSPVISPPPVSVPTPAPTFIPKKIEIEEDLLPDTDFFTLQDVKEPIPPTPQPKIEKFVPKPLPKREKVRAFKLPSIPLPRSLSGLNVGGALAGIAVFLAALAIFIGVPLSTFLLNVRKGVDSLEKVSLISKGQLQVSDAGMHADKASHSFIAARSSLYQLKWAFTVLGKRDQFNSYYRTVNSLAYFSAAVSNISHAAVPMESLWEVIRPDTDRTLDQASFDESKLIIATAQNNLKLAEADIKNVKDSSFPPQYVPKLQTYRNYLSQMDKGLALTSTLVSSLPDILGASGEKKYVIWFQNSNEIRPTGGFIGSYGVLKFENGKLKDLVIDDIYNPDGQIDVRNITVSPPKPIADYLAENKLYLRNSNWDPDFTKSVLKFEDLYFKVTGEKVDGFVAVDLPFVQKVLKVTGPIFLAAYNEEITAENLFQRAQLHSDFNYEEGVSQKRAFLSVLGSKLLEKLFALQKEKMPLLAGEINNALDEKHLLFSLANSPLSATLREQHWDGSLSETTGDYLYVVNSNLGGTKANYFVKNNMTYQIDSMTRDGLLRATLTLEYSHTGEDAAWPGGPYTNYVRVLTQNGSKLTGATRTTDTGEEDIFKTVVIAKEGQYTSFESGFKLDPGKTTKLILKYDLPVDQSITKDFKDYTMYWQKQPGTQDDGFTFVFNPPFGMSPENYSPEFASDGAGLKVSGKLNTDKEFFVNLR